MKINILIPGPAHAVLSDALDLPRECTLRDMVAEIGRLKIAAAEGPMAGRGSAPAEKRKPDRQTVGRGSAPAKTPMPVTVSGQWKDNAPQEPDAA